ncbi:MAG TPA: hypothetical protein VFI19_03065, partial [Nocardioides sp.]|nr:hypothetical protein [Nocardioides sp.]
QLSQLSAASVPPRREGPVRFLVAAVTVLVLASFSWLTGALPGVASPFDGARDHHPAPQQAPTTTPPAPTSESADAVPQPGAVPPGPPRTHQDNGHHSGLAKPNHHDNGNHTGLTDGQQDNGNHTGQTRPHQNHGQHTGQTTPHHNHGHHTGQTKPHDDNGHHIGQTPTPDTGQPGGTGPGSGQGNGHHT